MFIDLNVMAMLSAWLFALRFFIETSYLRNSADMPLKNGGESNV